MVLPAHALKAVQIRLKSVSNEGHFNHEVERVLRLYLPYDCSGVTEEYHMVFSAHAIQPGQIRLKWNSNEGDLTREVETVFRPISLGLQEDSE
jgi:hypothetical protein